MILIKCDLSVFLFWKDHTFDVILWALCVSPGHEDFSPVFSLKSFIVLHFTLSSASSWGNFCIRLKVCCGLCLRIWNNWLFQHHLLKRLYFLHRIALVPLSKIHWPIWDLLFCSVLSICAPGPLLIPHCLNHGSFRVSLKIGWSNPSHFILLQCCVGCFHKFRIFYKNFKSVIFTQKIPSEIFD